MKQQIRILGIDDSPFTFTDKYATVIGVVMRGGGYLECVLQARVLYAALKRFKSVKNKLLVA